MVLNVTFISLVSNFFAIFSNSVLNKNFGSTIDNSHVVFKFLFVSKLDTLFGSSNKSLYSCVISC